MVRVRVTLLERRYNEGYPRYKGRHVDKMLVSGVVVVVSGLWLELEKKPELSGLGLVAIGYVETDEYQ